MSSWYSWQRGAQQQASGESHAPDSRATNSVPYQQAAVENHGLDLNRMHSAQNAPDTPYKFNDAGNGSTAQVVGLAQVPHPAGVHGSFMSLLQQNGIQTHRTPYSHHLLTSNGNIVLNPYMLSGYHQMPPSQDGFSIQYQNNFYFSPEATGSTGVTGKPSFPFALCVQNPCNGMDVHSLKTNPVAGATTPQTDTRVTQSESPVCFDQRHASHSEASSFSIFKSRDHTNSRRENFVVDFSQTDSVQAPITPEKMNILGRNPATEIVNLVDDSESGGSSTQKKNTAQVGEEILKISSNQNAPQASISPMGTSLQQTEKQIQPGIETQGIDLNKTPQQKPKRKKHRPKVIREGKPARKPRQMTPMSEDGGVQRVKRKYVRKKGLNSSEILSDALETPPKAEGNVARTKRKYVRKKGLNSSESPSTALGETVDHTNTNSKRSAKRALNFDTEEPQASLRSPNCSLDFQSVEKPESNLDCTLNVQTSDRGSRDSFPPQNSEGTQELVHAVAPNVMFDLNHTLNEVTGCCTGLQGDSIPVVRPSRREMLKQNLKDLARKRDSLKAGKSCLEASSSQLQAINSDKEVVGSSDVVMANKINYNHDRSDTHPQDVLRNKRIKENCDNGSYGSTSGASFLKEFTCGKQHDTSATQLHGEHMLAFDQTERKRKLSLEAPTQVSSFTSLISGIVPRSQNLIHENQRPDSRVPETQVAGPSTTSMSVSSDPMDIVTLKMERLTINGGADDDLEQLQYHNALVPYNGIRTMVPVEGLFDSLRKRRARPKVDLDSETNRVWLLLMGKEGSTDDEEMDKDKEIWWEEQRKVFRGRVDAFIARMHQVQGDRRFSPWKGSVLDSVVGVFLTQNVSDHLSSSAFMSLAAKFPSPSRRKNTELDVASSNFFADNVEECMSHIEDGIKLLENKCSQQRPRQGFIPHENQQAEAAVGITGHILQRGDKGDFINIKDLGIYDEHEQSPIELLEKKEVAFTPVSEMISLAHSDDMRSLDSFFSSQSSVISSQNSFDSPVQSIYPNGPNSETGSEVNYVMSNDGQSSLDASSTSFMELLQMAGTSMFQELYHSESGIFQTKENSGMANDLSECVDNTMREYDFGHTTKVREVRLSSDRNDCHTSLELNDYATVSCDATVPHIPYRPNYGCLEVRNTLQKTLPLMPSSSAGHTSASSNHNVDAVSGSSKECTDSTVDKGNLAAMHNHSSGADINMCSYPLTSVEGDVFSREYLHNFSFQERGAKCNQNNESVSYSQILPCTMPKQQLFTSKSDLGNIKGSPSPNCQTHHHVNNCVTDMPTEENPSTGTAQVTTNLSTKKSSENIVNVNAGTEKSAKVKKSRPQKQQNKAFDWDSLRKQACNNNSKKQRSHDAMDSVDWEAIRKADVKELADTIRERGMNNMLAERIKEFLDRLVREHGSIDLEWLRDVPPDKAKDYLLSIRGLGLKSVECVRLLTLHHLAFPVDTNVGRICVRLGWVPLQPLPESVQLHLLEMYPLLETIQKYLWPRLCMLDQKTLYELHYQLITFGKVFCTKSKPNCNACPMRAECKHFASAFASARLALPGPEEKSLVNTVNPTAYEQNHDSSVSHMPPLQLEGNPVTVETVPQFQPEGNPIAMKPVTGNCEPIIEEPDSPEPIRIESLERDIEDAFYEDPDGIPTIHLNIEEFTQNLKNVIQENNMQLQDYDMSKALVALMPQAASIPQPKLKNVNRLRTEHQVYELQDSHPLLEGLDRREPDDPSPYLLAIWSPGETPESIEPPRASCDEQENGKLCDNATCASCNSIREAQAQIVRGTLLIPCRTAMRGSFPLNGTYFQVNEVFADHASSLSPIDVPREWLWNLPRRTVYFGTSVPSIFRGLTTEQIQHCFWRGFVCVRGFDQKTRAPRPLIARLHFPASKVVKNKKKPSTDE